MTYTVFIVAEAKQDISQIVDYIETFLCAPLTAVRFYSGLRKKVEDLAFTADIYSVLHRESLQGYGKEVRRVNYKKFAVIYTIEGSKVIIHRIIHGSLIV